ncbi:M20 family metallopeptidase [Nafulsella turpanensis]|uniref:M20 family metallopeptidase n=1 Tax=Nafulsella turpanensis TaxID=1265690 RepID=UPI000348397A|nr:M20/M25/M40 family metallo-hydrolase [Nafulsella turpanensis]
MNNRLQLLIISLLLFSTTGSFAQEKIVTAPDATLQNALSLLSSYVSFPSITGNELEAGRHFAAYCEEQGLYLRYFSEDTASYNFAATLYPLSVDKPVVWFQHHIDVVPPDNEQMWSYSPFEMVVENDTIYGRGVMDAKGLGVMQLMALLKFKEQHQGKELDFNVGLLCLSGEEYTGELGAGRVLSNHLEELKPAVVYGEGGAGMQNVLESEPEQVVYGVSVAEKAALWVKLELELVSFGHGATPAPEYANMIMINALSRLNNRKLDLDFNRTNKRMFRKLGRAEGGLRGFVISHMNWWVLRPFIKKFVKDDPMLQALTTNTVTVTKIFNPPGPPNSIASVSTAYLDCRLQPGVSKKAFIRHLKRILDDPRIEISEISIGENARPSSTGKYYDALEEAILEENPEAVVIPMLFPATTDNTRFRNYGIPTYGLVPALLDLKTIKGVHSIDERLPVSALLQGIEIYTNLLNELTDERVREKYRKESFFTDLESAF